MRRALLAPSGIHLDPSRSKSRDRIIVPADAISKPSMGMRVFSMYRRSPLLDLTIAPQTPEVLASRVALTRNDRNVNTTYRSVSMETL